MPGLAEKGRRFPIHFFRFPVPPMGPCLLWTMDYGLWTTTDRNLLSNLLPPSLAPLNFSSASPTSPSLSPLCPFHKPKFLKILPFQSLLSDLHNLFCGRADAKIVVLGSYAMRAEG